LACTSSLEKESMKRLEDLGVFGFKRKDNTNIGNNNIKTNIISNENSYSNNKNNDEDKVYTVQANGIIDVAIDGDVFA